MLLFSKKKWNRDIRKNYISYLAILLTLILAIILMIINSIRIDEERYYVLIGVGKKSIDKDWNCNDISLTYLAIGTFPALYADFIAVLVAGVMTEYVVSRPAELGTSRVVVMIRTLDAHAISQMSISALMIESVPRWARQDDSAVARFLDDAGARLVSRL